MNNPITPYRGPDWRKALFLAMLAYLLAFVLRAVEIPYWDNPDYRLDGEYLLGTHDAYYWMAGAEGFGRAAGHPFAGFIALLAWLTGATPANVGFWLPLFMAPLVASVVCVWAMVFGARSSGVIAGVLACLAPGFLGRTLLGYCDTDLVTLLFALLMGLAPAMWLSPILRSPLRIADILTGFKSSEPSEPLEECRKKLLNRFWLSALLVSGLFGHWARDWHSLFAYLPVWYALLIPFLIGLLGVKEYRPLLWRGAAVYALPLTGGAAGAAVAVIVACCLLRSGSCPACSGETPGNSERQAAFPGNCLFSCSGLSGEKNCFSKIYNKGCELLWKRLGALLLWGLAFLFAFDPGVAEALLASVGSYVKSSGDVARTVNTTEALVYPGVAQSIIEVQDLKLDDLLFYFHPWPFMAVAGMFGFMILLLISPAAAFHLPLIALSLLSIKLGGRMVMFGVASVALGMTVPIYLLAEGLLRRIRSAGLLQTLPLSDFVLLALLIPYAGLVPRLSNGPIMHVEYAEALKALRETTPPDAVIWTWWDWGYATQYLALRNTIADGALHGGAYLYLPALVYSTSSPPLAANVINYTSEAGGPQQVFNGLSPSEAMDLLGRLAGENVQTTPVAPQYLVVTFDMLRLGYWIGRHGSWNFEKKDGVAPKINRLRNALKFNLSSGEVEVEGQEKILPADSLDVLRADGLTRESYYRFNQRHFILNMISGDKLIIDDTLYNSMMTQLLLSRPEDSRFRGYFTPVFDNTYTRVYKVK